MSEIAGEITRRLLKIKAKRLPEDRDDEEADIQEDALHEYVLERIAEGDVRTLKMARDYARRALETREMWEL